MFAYQPPKPSVTGSIGRVNGNGAVIKPQMQPTPMGSPQSEETKEETPSRVYTKTSYQKYSYGPIGQMPENWSLFDLIFEQTPAALELRGYFDDWAIPETRTGMMEDGKLMTRVNTLRNFVRGNVRDTTYKAEQYLYAVLNPMLHTVADYASPNGTNASRANILVCCNVGDPRTGDLSRAYIEYALPLNTPWMQFIDIAGRVMVGDTPETRKAVTFYKIKGDPALEKRVGEMWFNHTDFRFNATIYPMARHNFGGDLYM